MPTGVACQVRRMPIHQPNFEDRVQVSDFVPPFNEPCSSPGFRQTSKRSFNRNSTRQGIPSGEMAVVTRITVRSPLTTDDEDERIEALGGSAFGAKLRDDVAIDY